MPELWRLFQIQNKSPQISQNSSVALQNCFSLTFFSLWLITDSHFRISDSKCLTSQNNSHCSATSFMRSMCKAVPILFNACCFYSLYLFLDVFQFCIYFVDLTYGPIKILPRQWRNQDNNCRRSCYVFSRPDEKK